MSSKASVNSCVEEVLKMSSAIQDLCPDAEVAISGVTYQKLGTYVTSEEKLKIINNKIESFNEQLKNLCSIFGLKFIDNSSISAQFICQDGVHLNWEGNELLSEHFSTFLQSRNLAENPGMLNDSDYPPLPTATLDCKNMFEISARTYSTKEMKIRWASKTVGESNGKKEKLPFLFDAEELS